MNTLALLIPLITSANGAPLSVPQKLSPTSAYTYIAARTVYIKSDDGAVGSCLLVEDPVTHRPNIYTAAHVVRGDEDKIVGLTIELKNGKKIEVLVDQIHASSISDFALIKLKPNQFPKEPSLKVRSDLALVGEDLFIVGAPANYPWVFSRSYVNQHNVFVNTAGYGPLSGLYLGVSSDIYYGNSGGPVCDVYGRVVGLVSWGASEKYNGTWPFFINFAVPGPTILTEASKLRK